MAVHAICPSIRCRKVLTFNDDCRGTVVTCRYCTMQFRIPRVPRIPRVQQTTAESPRSSGSAAGPVVASTMRLRGNVQ